MEAEQKRENRLRWFWGICLVILWGCAIALFVRANGHLSVQELLRYQPKNKVLAAFAMWGLFLLKSPPCESRIPSSCGLENTDFQSPTCGDVPMRTGGRSRGWLALVIPCPVCLSVVLMSVAGLVLYFPEEALAATIGLFAVFIAIAAISGLTLLLGRKETGSAWETSLGLIMCLMALYFALTALLMPHFSEISKIYRMSVHAHHGNTEDFPLVLLGWATIAALTLVGFVWNTRNFKKNAR